jgi:hypothetical protein
VRRLFALAASGLAAACLSAAAPAADPATTPDLGAGPHRDYDEQKGGPGARPRTGDPQPQLPMPRNAPSGASKDGAPIGKDAGTGQDGASTGGSAAEKDERKATESKEKAKKRPGYKDDAPSPRA